MESILTGRCPECGKELQIPAELSAFSCLYCGARLTPAQLRTGDAPAPDAAEQQAAYDHAVQRLAWCITNFPGYHRKITRNEFPEAYDAYEAACAPVVRELSSGVPAARQTELLTAAAQRMLDDLAAGFDKKGDMEDRKIVLAIFFVPMLRRQKLPISEEFAEILQKLWVGRYPKSPFYVGDYEAIAGGFRKKLFGLCFITTAVCEELGKPDDCAELTAFRRFRDTYLMQQPDGPALIDEYYNIAPGIVACINICTDRHARYARLREDYLAPCYDDLQNGRLASCKARYVTMVRSLEREFFS